MTQFIEDPLVITQRTLSAWAQRDLLKTLRYVSDDIDFYVNVDPSVAPYAASSRGKDAMRARLQLMLDTFHFDALVPFDFRCSSEQPEIVRVNVTYYYREKTTNSRLDGRFRFVFEVRDGKIQRIEELHDSHYVEAFARLVRMIEERKDREN